MAAKIETAFSFDADGAPDSPPHSPPQVGAGASSRGTRQYDRPSDSGVGAVSQGMTQADRAEALERITALVEYFDAEQHLFWTLWCRDGADFTLKAAYDLALSNYSRAIQIRDSLMRQAAQPA